MPNRYLRASYIDSRRINSLSANAERMFLRLIVHVDDFGRCEADIGLLLGKLFARQLDRVRERDVREWLAELVKYGLVQPYSVDGEHYLQMNKWERGRAMKSRYPSPHEANTCEQMFTDVDEREQPPPKDDKPDGFELFWDAYPKKVGKEACRRQWRKSRKPATDVILAAIERQKKSDQWKSEGGKYIPNPLTWLNQGRWDDEPMQGMKRLGDFEDASHDSSN